MDTKLQHNTTQCGRPTKLTPDIVYIQGATYEQWPTLPTPDLIIQIIEITFTHDRFLDQALQMEEYKYNSLIDAIRAQN